MSLVVAPCSHKAAKFAVENWHYSQRMPKGKMVRFGVWENDAFIGAIIFGRGATPHLGRPYALDQTEICELVRVALRKHDCHISQVVSLAMREVKANNPRLRLVVSFADPTENHHGGIYQAGNWVYAGQSSPARFFVIGGRVTHPRTVSHSGVAQNLSAIRKALDPGAEEIMMPGKHRYLYPLDKQMARRTRKLARPYPRRADEGSTVSRPATSGEVRVQLPASASEGDE